MRRLLAVALVVVPTVLYAQQSPRTISTGMTKAQVLAALGAPATLRSASDFTYLFYKNSCGKQCGMNDLVILRGDSVVDAIFRSAERHYTGVSSSPAPVPPKAAAHRSAPAARPARPFIARDSSVARPRMKPGPPNDTKPSIPLREPQVRPAAPTQPAPKSP